MKMTPEPGAVAVRQADTPRRSGLGELRAHLDTLVAACRQTMQQERLKAFREMAGEAAHDFPDPLSSILARAQILVADGQDQEVVQAVRTLERVAPERTRIVRPLHAFTLTHPHHPLHPP